MQVPLPAGCPVLLDVLFARQPGSSATQPGPAAVQQQEDPDRRVLHVQSISDWAPSCIGPYSQVSRSESRGKGWVTKTWAVRQAGGLLLLVAL
jgi:hypothetical protein